MKLSELKNCLTNVDEINFILPNGSFVPKHFHVTEVGSIDRKYIDCGGTLRNESSISFQLWEDVDFDHRLSASKLKGIIELAEKQLSLVDNEVEVEYQGSTIGRYSVDFENGHFILQPIQTDCLAKDKCGIPVVGEKQKLSLSNLGKENSCDPQSGCC